VATADGTQRVVISLTPSKTASTSGGDSNGPVPQASTPPPGEDSYELVQLKYADVSEVVGLLTDGQTVKSNDSFVPREPAFGSTSLTGGNYQPPPPNPTADDQPLGQSVDSAISIDRRLNAVWLKGSPEHIARLKAEIALIDVPVDSVILETELVELDDSGSKALGLDFNNSSGQIAVATAQSGQYNTNSTMLPNRILLSGELQAALYAQISKGKGKIVSKPRIAAQSGGTAKIITGDALPILTSITLSGVNGVSQQVQYVNVGVTLQIAPRVSADGFVTSHVFCVVSSVTGYSQGYPTISQREADTSATVKDGETFVIGGLTEDSTTSSDSRLPPLGDVPVLGQLFHHRSTTTEKTDLYIVVTPHVVRHIAAAPPAPPAPPPPPAEAPAPPSP
jgi:general secretion pathway protein D